MESIFDEMARVLAKPLPRRHALKLAAGVLAGGVLGALGVKQAAAQDATPAKCKVGTLACGKQGLCCPVTKKCCITATRSPFCAPSLTDTCCANTACGPKTVCCKGVCCAPGKKCVNGRCSASKEDA
jgi:hypothetical protein